MPGAGTEVFDGFLDVKVPSDVRKRALAPWKAWKRQWCAVRREVHDGAPLEVQIGFGADQKIQVSSTVAVWRTQSRSRMFAFGVFCGEPGDQRPVLFLAGRNEAETQRWMQRVRHMTRTRQRRDAVKRPVDSQGPVYHVSVIDNDFTRAARLTGMYGDLKVTAEEVVIVDPCTDEVKTTWHWGQLHKFQLVANGVAEDRGKICLIRTSSAFSGGAGNIYLYCERAADLLESLVDGGDCSFEPRSPPLPLRNTRRLSRSENDIRTTLNQSRSLKASSIHMVGRRIGMLARSPDLRKRLSSLSGRGEPKNKTATRLISASASLGLMFTTTPTTSKDDIDGDEEFHDFQEIYSSYEDLADVVVHIPTFNAQRRQSTKSAVSNIYEEIPEMAKPEDMFILEETEAIYANLSDPTMLMQTLLPPPLPPRRRCALPVRSASFGSMRSLFSRSSAQGQCDDYVEPDYLPMSPGLGIRFDRVKGESSAEEQHYVVMANLEASESD